MGVHGLWRLLETTGKPINPETLEGKILAVDISIWLNQAVKGVRDREGNSVQNAHLLTLFNRICKLLFFRIKPVFVFDGEAPLLKKQTLALRRQRKEELTRESKQTNEKLLKTFLKRQAIKAALGDRSKDPLPSLSNVKRDEVDDIYVLPALPPAEEKDNTSSEEDEEEQHSVDIVDSYYTYQGEVHGDPNSVDINSEEFASLPLEMKHEILKDMKEFSKRRRTMYQKPPEQSGDFSQYQLAGLLQRNRLNQRLEGVEKEMNQRSAGTAPQIYEEDGDQKSHSVESKRLVSEDHSHYILIKGTKKTPTATQSQPAAAPWSLSDCRKRAKDRPEPLWHPITEEDEDMEASSSGDSNPSVSKPAQENTSPPSPRTLKAIQAAMSDSSDDEKVDKSRTDDGRVSPRTLLAIQQALSEDQDHRENECLTASSTKLQAKMNHPVPQVVISSSEEEEETSPKNKLDHKENPPVQSSHVEDGLLASSSDDEMVEIIGQRNKALRFSVLQESSKKEEKTENGQIPEKKCTGSSLHMEKKAENSEIHNTKAEIHHVPLEDRKNKINESLEKTHGNDIKSENSEESESEESFVEVSEEEDADDSTAITRDTGSSDEVPMKEEKSEESLTHSTMSSEDEEDEKSQDEEKDEEKEAEAESTETPATNEWEHIDMGELEALDGSLQVEQNNLREQKQQQERMANTVTGQMYLESQELLRLFGVPFLVAPMEAEAQCAALDRADQTHGTITDDSDVWLFGGRHVYKNFFSQNKYVEHYQYSDLQNQLGLDRTKLINLAYLLGSDYTEGVPGVGYVTGMEILNEFPGPGLEPLNQFSKWWIEAQEKKRLVSDPRDTKVKRKLRELKLQPGFPNPSVAQAYMQPAVDDSDGSFSWGRPQLDMIKEFCLSRFGWNSRRTDETLQPVIKQLSTQQTQLWIDSFFRMEQQEKQEIRSQRLRRAVTCLKRKEREGGEEEEEESEEERPSPSKNKKSDLKKDEKKESVVGGGFLGLDAESPLESLKDFSTESISVKTNPQSGAKKPHHPQMTRTNSTSSSSGEDSDGGQKVAMVTARSVFEGCRRGRGAKRGRGRGRGKKL